MFIYAVVLIAFFSISITAAADSVWIFVEVEKTGESIEFFVDPYHTSVYEFKIMISRETGIPPILQQLRFEFMTLESDSRLLSDYRITDDGYILYLNEIKRPEQTEHSLEFFRLCDECMLPATGFSSLRPAALSAQPNDLRYTDVGMRLMIPSLDLDSELVSVPMDGNSWAVEWLDDRGGVLEGSALPGEGFSVVAAHNTLNDMEYGPFALLGTLELNELIAVSGIGSGLRTFRVFANELLAPDDIDKMASIAEREENSLVLITCENESVDGGYLNRRVIFAKPVF